MLLTLEANPLRVGLKREHVADPCAFIIFGATGDLSQRKLFPALYSLYCHGLLPSEFSIIGAARSEHSDEDFREMMRKAVEKSGELRPGSCAWDDFAEHIRYVSGNFDQPGNYDNLMQLVTWSDDENGTRGNRLIYLAVPPSNFADIARNLKEAGLSLSQKGWTRIMIEKPFGTDLASAKSLNDTLQSVFREEQIFRIDHYLGKETVQNILALRFANSILEPVWNYKYIDHVQITIAETLGVEERGEFYDKTGALRDVIQNHGLQLLSLVAMEPPASLSPNDVRDEKAKVFRNVKRMDESEVSKHAVRGQYGAGYFVGEQIPAYRDEKNVNPESNTETFAALELYIDNWRWAGVPFYIRTGKRLPHRTTEIAIQFRDVPEVLFKRVLEEQVVPDVLAIKVQPDEGVTLRIMAKVPGQELQLQPVQMEFRYGSSFALSLPEAYERLFLDAVLGDASLFARKDGIEEEWEIITPILNFWQSHKAMDFPNYLPGTWGPQQASDLIGQSGRRWRRL